MKTRVLTAIFVLIFFNISAYGTIHIVTQVEFTFSPSTLNVNVGDTVKWIWSSGSHTTTSQNIPAGAESWDSPLNGSINFFQYKVTVPGTYNYFCTPHQNMGMVGVFVASATTSISTDELWNFSIFPNPAVSVIHLKSNSPLLLKSIEITNLIGNRVYVDKESGNAFDAYSKKIDVSSLPTGIYLVSIALANGKRITHKISITK